MILGWGLSPSRLVTSNEILGRDIRRLGDMYTRRVEVKIGVAYFYRFQESATEAGDKIQNLNASFNALQSMIST